MNLKVICVLVLGMLARRCASIVSGTSQSMFIETPKHTGASCKLTDSKSGEWYLPSTPGSATVQKGNGPMNIICEKEGYETTTVSVEESSIRPHIFFAPNQGHLPNVTHKRFAGR